MTRLSWLYTQVNGTVPHNHDNHDELDIHDKHFRGDFGSRLRPLRAHP